MTTAAAWVVAAALWAGALHPGPWWLAPAGLAVLATLWLTARSPARSASPDEPPPGSPEVEPPPGSPRVEPLRGRTLTAAAVAVALAGSGLAGGRIALADGGLLPALAARGGTAEMAATVVSEARPMEPASWEAADARPGWLLVRVNRLAGRRVRERALLRLDDVDDAPALGERLALTASARPLERDGFGGYLRRRHTTVALNLGTLEVTRRAGPVLAASNRIRARTRAAYARHLAEEHAGLLAGLVVGDRAGRSPERTEQFAAAGLSHLVVVSGRHVALMLAGVLATCAVAGLGARGRRWAGLAALGWFAVLVRWQPSVLRASVMGGLVLGAGLLGRGSEPRHHLAVAVTLLLLADPLLAGQVGFALSVLATAGVLILAPWLASRLPGPRPVRLLLAVTVGAQLGAAPVLLAAFEQLPLAAVPANLVAVPAAGVAQTVGMAAAVVAQLSPVAGGWVAVPARPALSVILWAAEAFSGGPALRPAHLWSPLALTAVGLLGGHQLAQRASTRLGRWTLRLSAAALLVAVVVATLPAGVNFGPLLTPRLTAFDVGQGDALLVEIPGDPPRRLLYDGGPQPDAALGHLRRRGIDRLDVAVASHPHQDHLAGLPAVLDELPVTALLIPPLPAPGAAEELVGVARSLPRTARDAGVAVHTVAAGQRFRLGDATVEVLSPPAEGLSSDDPNALSLVLRVHTPAGRMLLTGDAEATAQQRLLRHPERLRAEVLQVPHHGGATNAAGFLDAVRPATAVLSVGADNDHGHPHPDVLAELAGVPVKRTDRDGSLTVALPRRGRATPRRTRAAGCSRAGRGARPAGARPPAATARVAGRLCSSRNATGKRNLPCATPSWSAPCWCSASRRAPRTPVRARRRGSGSPTPPRRPPVKAPLPSPWR